MTMAEKTATETATSERVFRSIQEVCREFFPGICAECGHDCSYPTSRVRVAIDIPEGARTCARCGHEWAAPEETCFREPDTAVRGGQSPVRARGSVRAQFRAQSPVGAV